MSKAIIFRDVFAPVGVVTIRVSDSLSEWLCSEWSWFHTDARQNALSVSLLGLVTIMVVWPFVVVAIATMPLLSPASLLLVLQVLVPIQKMADRMAVSIFGSA